MPRDEPITKKIPCTRVLLKTFDKKYNKLVDRTIYLYGAYPNREQMVEAANERLKEPTTVILEIIKSATGIATVTMSLETYLSIAKLHHSTIIISKKEKQK